MVFKFGEHPEVNVIESKSKEKKLSQENFKDLLDFVIEEYMFLKNKVLAERPNSRSFARQMADGYRELRDNQEFDAISDEVARTIYEMALVVDRGMGFGRSFEKDKQDARWQASMVRLINQCIDDPEALALIERSWQCFNTRFWEKSDTEPFISGIKGVVTATHLFNDLDLDLDLRLPTPEEDVKHKIDLWAKHDEADSKKVFAFQIKTSKHFYTPRMNEVVCDKEELIRLKGACISLQYSLKECEPEEEAEIRLELDIARSKISLAEHINSLKEERPDIEFSAYWLSVPGYLGTGAKDMDIKTGQPKDSMKDDFMKNNNKIIKQF